MTRDGDYSRILLAHGGGGRLSRQLIDEIMAPAFANPDYDGEHDGAVLPTESSRIVMTTDSFVIKPLFFPGGDIGKLAVCGTVNDLAMCGARPQYLSVGFIIEEGLKIGDLRKVVASMTQAAAEARVRIVTGDTKVVERGKGDGLYINTTGVGAAERDRDIHPRAVRPGDAILISGDIGRHGIAVMAQRQGLELETTITSDCASLSEIVWQLMQTGVEMHCLRDLTRGGLASALVEIAETSGSHLRVREESIPVTDDVVAACELLGLDPLYVANEGCFIAFVPASEADRALAAMRSHPLGAKAAIIGDVERRTAYSGEAVLRTVTGTERLIDMFSGEQLPRIC